MEPVNDSLSEELRCTLSSITARLVAFIGDEIAANCAPALTKGAARAHERPSWPPFDPCFRRRADGAGVCFCRPGMPAFQQFIHVLFERNDNERRFDLFISGRRAAQKVH